MSASMFEQETENRRQIDRGATTLSKRIACQANRRGRKGSAVVELACSSIFLVIFAIFAVYMSLLVICAHITDRAARDAARAAAQTKPQSDLAQTKAQAILVAQSVLKSFASASPFMSDPSLQNLEYEDYNGSPPAETSPYVSVTVVSTAKLPFAPTQFFGHVYGTEDYTFSQTYTFPIVNIR